MSADLHIFALKGMTETEYVDCRRLGGLMPKPLWEKFNRCPNVWVGQISSLGVDERPAASHRVWSLFQDEIRVCTPELIGQIISAMNTHPGRFKCNDPAEIREFLELWRGQKIYGVWL